MAHARIDPTSPAGFFLDPGALRVTSVAYRTAYASARPFPHLVLDQFLGAPLAEKLARVFPSATHPEWKRRDYPEQTARLGQLQRNAFTGVDGALRQLLAELSGMAFIDFLQSLTGLTGLIPDPHFRGAGLHLTLRGGHLALHADFNRDRFRNLARKVTVLYYLNPGWTPAWGGELELWNEGLTACEANIAPRLDRMVVLAHGETHWHGHPKPLTCPVDEGRAAVVAYFYTADAPAEGPGAHGAIWVKPAKGS